MAFGKFEELNKELEKTKKKLEDLNHFKNHLLSLTSHEVRAQLAAIMGYASNARQGLFGEAPAKIKEIFGKIEFAAEDLINFLDNIVDLRRIEEGRVEYKREDIDLVKLAKEIVDLFKPLAKAKNLEFTFTSPQKEILFKGDRHYLKHSMQNLIDNAIKYTPKGFVKIELKNGPKEIIFSVCDSGIGIKPGTAPLIFEEFVRDERVDQSVKGSGLGLFITRNVIEAHGGKIWCESEGEGKGSIFAFSLPTVKNF